ncbi:MAG: T9SS type A sorting domain-containing protein [Flavobacteriales bacterium]
MVSAYLFIRDKPGTSFHNAAVEVGISRYDSTFGQTIHISQVPQHDEDWIQQSVVFKPQFAANHLSIKMRFPPNSMKYPFKSQSDYSIRFYVFVDNFVLSELTSTDERVLSQTKLYPNPSNGELFVETAKGEYIQSANVLGKVLHQEKILPNKKNAIWIDHLEQGNYILHILNKDGNFIENKKFIKTLN